MSGNTKRHAGAQHSKATSALIPAISIARFSFHILWLTLRERLKNTQYYIQGSVSSFTCNIFFSWRAIIRQQKQIFFVLIVCVKICLAALKIQINERSRSGEGFFDDDDYGSFFKTREKNWNLYKTKLEGFFGKWEGWYFFILSRFRCHDHDDSIRCLGIFCTGFWCRFFFVRSMTSRDCLAQFEKVTFALTRRSSASF